MKNFILDVDGVMTTGQFLYTNEGKSAKVFGPDDNDALSLLKGFMEIMFVTGDKKGFNISEKRIQEDMGYSLYLVSTINRITWIKERFEPSDTIYMGDGIFDYLVMRNVAYSIAPANGDFNAKYNASYVTKRSGGDRAVAEACLHILDKFFNVNDIDLLLKDSKDKNFGEWTV
tara:strand:- start:1284 stop:1802 length:519 start_codon:yes stop_codon:yes gene_type:complete